MGLDLEIINIDENYSLFKKDNRTEFYIYIVRRDRMQINTLYFRTTISIITTTIFEGSLEEGEKIWKFYQKNPEALMMQIVL